MLDRAGGVEGPRVGGVALDYRKLAISLDHHKTPATAVRRYLRGIWLLQLDHLARTCHLATT